MTTSKDGEKLAGDLNSGQGRFTVLPALVWAVIPAAILSGLLGISYLASDSSQLEFVVLLIFMLPAACICQTLGLGTFSFFGGTTPPAMWPIMAMLAYIYGLVFVLIIRGLWRLIQFARRRSVQAL
jgi:hypothetical protein